MPSGRVLLVAPDTDLRRSLVFALETDGFAVVVRDSPPTRAWLASNRFDCTILDQKALAGPDYEDIAFCIKAHPVVLVSAKPHPWLVEWVAEVVDMPIAAGAVSAAIEHATGAEAHR
jgi:hypothetical protein